MQLSFNGMEFLKDAEGFRAKAYKDTGGVWTIGYGTTVVNGKPVCQGQECTSKEAEIWLQQDVAYAQSKINSLVKVPLKQTMFDALTSFVYNIGDDAFLQSTMLRKLNKGDYFGAAREFDRWVYDNGKVIPGLVSRRKRERSLFES